MLKKSASTKGKLINIPVQKLKFSSLQKSILAFQKKFNTNPSRLVLQFEIDFRIKSSNNFQLAGYLVSVTGKNFHSLKMSIPVSKNLHQPINLTTSKVMLGTIVIRIPKLTSLANLNNGDIVFTPRLYPNPHIAYDVNGYDLNPSPPAKP